MTNDTTTRGRKNAKVSKQSLALKCYWEEKQYGETRSAILCGTHRDAVSNQHPNLRGNGEWHAANECEFCR